MNIIKWAIIAILGFLGLNYFFNPPMNEKQEEEYWGRQESLLEEQLKTQEILERLSDKQDKLKNTDKSLLDKAREEWEKE